jgi:hypothetical protein
VPRRKELGPALGSSAEGPKGRLLSRGPAKVRGYLVSCEGGQEAMALGGEAKGLSAGLRALLLAPCFGRQEQSQRLPQGGVIVLSQPAPQGQLGGIQERRRIQAFADGLKGPLGRLGQGFKGDAKDASGA